MLVVLRSISRSIRSFFRFVAACQLHVMENEDAAAAADKLRTSRADCRRHAAGCWAVGRRRIFIVLLNSEPVLNRRLWLVASILFIGLWVAQVIDRVTVSQQLLL